MSYDEHLISMAGGDGDGDMADVLAAHLYDLRTHSCACMEKRRNPPHLGFKKHAAHQAAMLTAAGFGLVREAQAVALEEAADDFEGNIGVGEFDELASRDGMRWTRIHDAWEYQGPYMDWLRARAVTVRGGQ